MPHTRAHTHTHTHTKTYTKACVQECTTRMNTGILHQAKGKSISLSCHVIYVYKRMRSGMHNKNEYGDTPSGERQIYITLLSCISLIFFLASCNRGQESLMGAIVIYSRCCWSVRLETAVCRIVLLVTFGINFKSISWEKSNKTITSLRSSFYTPLILGH